MPIRIHILKATDLLITSSVLIRITSSAAIGALSFEFDEQEEDDDDDNEHGCSLSPLITAFPAPGIDKFDEKCFMSSMDKCGE